MLKLNPTYIKNIVKKALEEDLKPRGDITTNLIKKKDRVVRALIIAKQANIEENKEIIDHFTTLRYDSLPSSLQKDTNSHL